MSSPDVSIACVPFRGAAACEFHESTAKRRQHSFSHAFLIRVCRVCLHLFGCAYHGVRTSVVTEDPLPFRTCWRSRHLTRSPRTRRSGMMRRARCLHCTVRTCRKVSLCSLRVISDAQAACSTAMRLLSKHGGDLSWGLAYRQGIGSIVSMSKEWYLHRMESTSAQECPPLALNYA